MAAWLRHLSYRFTKDRAVLGGLLMSLAAGLLFYVVTASLIENDAEQRFSNMALSARATVNARIKGYADLLRGSASLFATSTELTRSQFHHYVEGLELDKNFPGVQTINYARYIDGAERASFEARMNQEANGLANGYPAFKITPPGQRPYYTVLTYIEPISAWARRYGWDISALGKNEALELSRDTGELCASGAPIAPLSGDNRVGLAMRLPIYRRDVPHDDVAGRRAAYLGSVGIGFSVNALMAGVIDQLPVHNVSMLLKDVSEPDPKVVETQEWHLLFDSEDLMGKRRDAPRIKAPVFTKTLTIDFAKRRWEAQFSVPRSNLYSRLDVALPWLTTLLGSVSTFLLFSLFHTISTSRRHAVSLATNMTQELRTSQSKLQRSNENLRRLAAHTNNIKEEERRRIAREIHDELGQSLMALRIEADMLVGRTQARQPRLHARAMATVRQIDATIKSVRQIINDLRPSVLDLGLSAAVEWQVNEFRRRTGIECRLIEPHGEVSVSEQCATALFRIVQESLSNISRHAHASKVSVELSIHGGWITIDISDNGVGIPQHGRRRQGSFGLVGIEERLNILNGVFRLDSSPGKGTSIHVSVPVNADPVLPTEFLEVDEPQFQFEPA